MSIENQKKFSHFINGTFCKPISNRWIEVVKPATGEKYGEVADGTSEDVELAVQAAENAFSKWSSTTKEYRSKVLHSIANLIDDNQEELAKLETIDTGKPISAARKIDIPRAAENFRFFAQAILEQTQESFLLNSGAKSNVIRAPRGITGIISPWNLPLYLLTWKIAPALATGNTVIAKPSELTPSTATRLCELIQESGMPNGVLNIIHGKGSSAGEPLVKHAKISTISFTGGTETGEKIASAAAPNFKRVALEMGGKNPSIVFANANLKKAINGVSRAAFSNMGQICLCGSRLLIQDTVYEKVVQGISEYAASLKIGNPLEESTQQGSLVSKDQQKKVQSAIDLALKEGAHIRTGGKIPTKLPKECVNGYFFEPTVIEGLKHHSTVVQKEIFGPVVTTHPFSTEDEAIELANKTEYGLAANIWTNNLNQQERVSKKIEAGIVWINCWMIRDLRTPFGGMKRSGLGREGGTEALNFFTEPKTITSLNAQGEQ